MRIQFLTATDKPALTAALAAVGIKARVKVLRQGLRVCFVGSQDAVLAAVNGLGFVNLAGKAFDANSFNQPHEIFVLGKVA